MNSNLLTNDEIWANKQTKKFYLTMGGIILLLVGFLFTQKSCQSDNGFRVEHSARMGGGGMFHVEHDTTKPKSIPQQKIVYNHYKLEGSDTLFQLLWLQCSSPADVTPRNLQKLQSWLQTNIRQDTTAKQ